MLITVLSSGIQQNSNNKNILFCAVQYNNHWPQAAQYVAPNLHMQLLATVFNSTGLND